MIENKNVIKNLYGLGDYNTNQIKALAEFLQIDDINPSDVYNRRPDANLSPGRYIKSMDQKEIPYIVPDAFAGNVGMELMKNLNIQQLEKIGAEGDAYLKETIKIILRKTLQQQLQPQIKNNLLRIQNYIQYSPAWQ
ncbi:MAG: hypothetical protein ABIH48_02980 [Candidatus Falkowbacteria bacterium]